MKLFVHDYETTGVNTSSCGVVQACTGIVEVNEDGTYKILQLTTAKLDPMCEIPANASAVHGLYKKDVEGCRAFDEYLTSVYSSVNGQVDGICGYNSNTFDNQIAARFGLDTSVNKVDLIIAVRKLKQMKMVSGAKLSVAYEELTGNTAENAHDAEADVKMTLELIPICMDLLDIKTFSKFLDFLQSTLNTMPFGKHFGKKLCDVPTSYLRWLLDNTDLSGDMLALVKAELGARN